MPGASLDTPTDHVRAWRSLLVIVAAAVPAFGLVQIWLEAGTDPGMPMRLAMSAVSLAMLAGSYRNAWIRKYLRPLCIGISCWLQAWFVHTAAAAGMTAGHMIGLMLISAIAVSLFRSPAELAAYSAFVYVSVLIAYRDIVDPAMDLSLFLLVLTTVLGGMGSIILSRSNLEQALIRSQQELEQRVALRTAELAQEVSERRAAEAEALRASRAKSRFLANMSHELRTPLNAIVGYTEIVQDELGEQPELVGDLDRVLAGAHHLLRMIDDILDLSRIEDGRLEVSFAPVDIGRIVSDTVRLLEPARVRSGSTVQAAIPAGLTVRTDADRLARILMALLSNALKFTTDGQVRVTAALGRDTVVITVEDTGIGIPPAALERLFEPFFQVDDSSTRRRDGSGLGLALSHDLARRLGGALTARSEVGRGSVFTLALPLDPPGTVPAVTPRTQSAPPTTSRQG